MDLDEWLSDVLRDPSMQLQDVRQQMRTAVVTAVVRRFSLELSEMAKVVRGLESEVRAGHSQTPLEKGAATAIRTFLNRLDPEWRTRFRG